MLSVLIIATCAIGCGPSGPAGPTGDGNVEKSELRVGNLLSGFGEQFDISDDDLPF